MLTVRHAMGVWVLVSQKSFEKAGIEIYEGAPFFKLIWGLEQAENRFDEQALPAAKDNFQKCATRISEDMKHSDVNSNKFL